MLNSNSIEISTVPWGTVRTPIFSTNRKGLVTNTNLLRNALEPSFSLMERLNKKL